MILCDFYQISMSCKFHILGAVVTLTRCQVSDFSYIWVGVTVTFLRLLSHRKRIFDRMSRWDKDKVAT